MNTRASGNKDYFNSFFFRLFYEANPERTSSRIAVVVVYLFCSLFFIVILIKLVFYFANSLFSAFYQENKLIGLALSSVNPSLWGKFQAKKLNFFKPISFLCNYYPVENALLTNFLGPIDFFSCVLK
jgi:hypothetical protein